MIKKLLVLATLSAFGVSAAMGQGITRRDAVNPRSAQFAGDPAAQSQQDLSKATRLRWVGPPGSRPGTYAEYLAEHPLSPLQLHEVSYATTTTSGALRSISSSGNISILVHTALYPSITTALNTYKTDLETEGYTVYIATASGGTPAQIKNWVQARYQAGSDGFLFIGDIPVAWYQFNDPIGEVDEFPSDLYYMDMDGTWIDGDGNGLPDSHTDGSGDQGPEVYVSRIYTPTLSWNTQANLVNDYLAKVHSYRMGTLTAPYRGLEYIDADWNDWDVALDEIYGAEVDRYDIGYLTTGVEYLARLAEGYQFVQVMAHSGSGGHGFTTRPTECATYAHVYVYSPDTKTGVRMRLGSNDGIKVWLNGALKMTRDTYQGWMPDQFQATNLTLNAGWNRLLVKVSQDSGDYMFSARIANSSGQAYPDLQYQINDPDLYGPEAPFINKWLLNGFYPGTGLSTNRLGVTEGSVNPQPGDVMGGNTWTAYTAAGPYVNMDTYPSHGDDGVSYAFVRVISDTAKQCQLWLGYDDSVRVWLNGKMIAQDTSVNGWYYSEMRKVNVNLVQGTNRLLVKVYDWIGWHGFSARLCNSDGSPVAGLTYDPEPAPISYIGTWLINGPYTNEDWATRLSYNYLGDETTVRPYEGKSAPFETWRRGIHNAYPFEFEQIFGGGDEVTSDDIQHANPPCLFYNLFACSAGRFTDNNYLSGSYIYNTDYGLICIASTKTGSMMQFENFTIPLAEGQSFGEAYRAWFDAQAPYTVDGGQIYWFYGMALSGDPTLRTNIRTEAPSDLFTQGWVWFSIPRLPPARLYPSADPILGFPCRNRLFSWSDAKTFLIYPDDFTMIDVGRMYMLQLNVGESLTPCYEGTEPTRPFSRYIPSRGYSWVGVPGTRPIAGVDVRVFKGGVTRTAVEDRSAPDPWINWNWIYWVKPANSYGLMSPFGGGDDNTLRPWQGYMAWANTDDVTIIFP